MQNNKTIVFFLFLFFILCFHAKGQIEHQSTIPSTTFHYTGKLTLADLNTISTPTINTESLVAMADSLDLQSGHYYFGKGITCNVDVQQAATHETMDDGSDLYRLRIIVPGAKGLQFFFDQFYLPQGALLYFYNPEKTKILGAFNNQNNKSYNKFSTTIIKSDTVVIEYYVPHSTTNDSKSTNANYTLLHINRIVVDFRQPAKSGPYGQSLPCEINVACPQGDYWKSERASVALILYYDWNYNLEAQCTGSLINNTNQDCTPYFISANHCIEGSSNAFHYWDWVFMFHHEALTCAADGSNAPTTYTISGCTYLASNNVTNSSDYLFLKLSQTPPLNYDVCYEGWDRTGNINSGDNVVGIHHPAGDVMKISIGTISNTSTQWDLNLPSTDFIKVLWNAGGTEPGSSGSPLYFQYTHSFIGQLYGGEGDCSTPQKPDYYGRFSESWTDGNLAQWLDPNNLGVMTLSSYCPNDYGGCGNGTSNGGGSGGITNTCDGIGYPTIDQGFSVNYQSSGIVTVCPDDNIEMTSCIQYPTFSEPNPNCTWWQHLWHTCTLSGQKYFVSFYRLNDDLTYNSSEYTKYYHIVEYNSNDFIPPYYVNWRYLTDIRQFASDAGITLTPGHFYRFKIGGTYSTNDYQEYTRYFYIISPDKTIQNINLNLKYEAANHLTFKNDIAQSGSVSSGKARESIYLLPNTDIKKGAVFTAEIDPTICPSISKRKSKSEPSNTILPLPSDFYNHSNDKLQNKNNSKVNNSFIKIYPNPSHQIFNVNVSGSYTLSEISVYDVTQRRIDAKITKTTSHSFKIDMSNQAKGVYFFRIGATVKRMVLE